MAISRCPGQDRRYWRSDQVFDAPCPSCGKPLEFWKSEARRRCINCGKYVLNPQLDLGCAKWCKQAAECLGLPVSGSKADSLCDALIEEMKKVFGQDRQRIGHALEVLDYAERILQGEPGDPGDPLVVKASAVLHDIGIQEAERKHGSAGGRYQEIEGPPIARAILAKFEIDADRVEHICRIIAHHHSVGDVDSPEFRIIWDADRLANIPAECPGSDPAKLAKHVKRCFRTQTGRELAGRIQLR